MSQLAIIRLILVLAFLGFNFSSPLFAGKIGADCRFNGINLKGKMMVVNSFPDIKVQIVSSFPDLKVQMVNAFPNECGKWLGVTSFPDFKVQFVNSFPDIKIQYVNSFPGVP